MVSSGAWHPPGRVSSLKLQYIPVAEPTERECNGDECSRRRERVFIGSCFQFLAVTFAVTQET
jgi:hypothetical protein